MASAPTENGKKVLTMAEYIEKKALMVALCKEITGDGDYYNGKDDMQDEIRDMVSRFPAADVAPVRHGRWINHTMIDGHIHAECSECHKVRIIDNFCPNCGCRMDGGAE